MCCLHDSESSSTRSWFKTLLFVWLLATSCRQAFDLIGRLWLPVLVNLVQILILIAGIFAVYQRRVALLIVLSVACFFSTLYNIAIILWYNNVFGDVNRPLLSMGLQHGYSFFVQHTPLCDSFFNVTTARWTQKSSCLVKYDIIESAQASLHIILAFLTAIFSILVVRQHQNNTIKECKAHTSQTQLDKMHIASSMQKPNNCRPPNSNSSTSYMNSSYENPEAFVEPQMVRRTPNNTHVKLPKRQNVEQSDNFSSAPTIELNSNKSGSTNTDSSEQPKSKRLLRELPARRSCGSQLAKILDQSMDTTSRYSKIGDSAGISHSRRRSEHLRPTASANNAVKTEDEDAEYMETRSRIAARLANLNGESVVGKTSPYHKRQGSAGNLTSLISFDPKSDTLIQVHEHQHSDDDNETIDMSDEHQNPISYRTRPNSRDSAPAFPAPTPPRVFANDAVIDSGHPSTNSNSSPNWSQGGISFPAQFQSNYMPISHSREMSVKSPESINYEQLGCPLVSTAFPVVTHSRQRSYCGVSACSSVPLAKQHPPPIDYNYQQKSQQPIVTHFSRAFHDRWVSADRSHEDLPPPPKTISMISNSGIPQQEHHPDPRVEGLLV